MDKNHVAWIAGFVTGCFATLVALSCAVLVAFAWRLT